MDYKKHMKKAAEVSKKAAHTTAKHTHKAYVKAKPHVHKASRHSWNYTKNNPKVVGIIAAIILILLVILLWPSGPSKVEMNNDFAEMIKPLNLAAKISSDGKDITVGIKVPSDATPEYLIETWYYIFGSAAGIYSDDYDLIIKNLYDDESSVDIEVSIDDVNNMLDEKISYAEFSKKIDIDVS